jgi:polysaccharide export outer membrane protein|tara:strand:- start:107 stop:2602 length:2496 start_codon:yes stop_codon:yes gene_type:complete
MTPLNISKRWLLSIAVTASLFSGSAFSQGLGDIKELCGDLTPANKAMAAQAGYDVDQLCSEIPTMAAAKAAVPAAPKVARETVSSTQTLAVAVAPVAVAGVGEAAPASSLKPFGYDLFANAPTTFAPAASIPVSSDYLLGPGDTLDILFYGKTNTAFSLEINREGFVDFPQLGPVGLAGLTYGEAKDMLQARIAAQIIGTQVSISMGSLRSMQVFVLGEAFKPGAYTVSSLSTITHALVSSGGVSDIGSLRNIQLKRQGKLVATLDLYDLLLAGDTSNDVRVQAADVIYIPTVGDLASIEGQVLRPAIYELKGTESIQDLVELAGGMGPKAFAQSARLQRINFDGFMTTLDVDLTQSEDKSASLRGGDHLTVDAITNYKKDVVSLQGAVRHEGDFAWRDGMRVSDIVATRDKLNPDADLGAVMLVREIPNSADIEMLIFSFERVLADFSSEDNQRLMSRDKIIVLSAYGDRATQISPYITQLKRQATLGTSAKIVASGGTVRFPGEYPLVEGMSIDDLIRLSGGLVESAYSQSAEIARIDLSNPNRAVSSIVVSSLTGSSTMALQPSDYVEFRTIPDFRETQTISLEGEFVFPGTYAFDKGENLSSVIQRAGGFTDEAFVDGSIFLREALKIREQQELDRLAKVLNDDLNADRLRDANSNIAVDDAQLTLQRNAIEALASAEAQGRLVIPLMKIVNFSVDDVALKTNDRLLIPKFSQEVTVIGEVQRPTSYLYDASFSQADYLMQSGGIKPSADKRGIYVVKAGGQVIMPTRGWFRFRSAQANIGPGDTIVVPLDTDDTRIRGIPLLAEVSTIIYQLALGAAAVNSFSSNP